MPGTLSFRDVEDLLAERGIVVSYETVRRWVKHVGSMIAADLRRRRPKPHSTWHLDEGFTKIDGRLVYLWRAVDAEGEVLDVFVQSKRDKRAAQKDLIIGCRYRIGGVPVPPVPHFPRFRALALFGRRPQERVDRLVNPASENLRRSGHPAKLERDLKLGFRRPFSAKQQFSRDRFEQLRRQIDRELAEREIEPGQSRQYAIRRSQHQPHVAL
jgi:DDE domain